MQTRPQTPPELPVRIRLICLACSRQDLAQYRTWAQTLSDPIELVAVDACAQAPHMLARNLADQLQNYLAQPHALFGQGAGAHVAFALAAQAQGRYPGQTRHVFVSSCDSPAPTADGAPALLQVPMTVLYLPGTLAATLAWHAHARRALELIELPPQSVDPSLHNQRLVRIFNTHLGLLSY